MLYKFPMTRNSFWKLAFGLILPLLLCNVNGDSVNIWSSASDSLTLEATESCVSRKIYTITDEGADFLRIRPNKWNSGIFYFGCLGKTDGVCTKTCAVDGQRPNLGEYSFLTFQARATGALVAEGSGCKPQVSMKGGSYPRKTSNAVHITGDLVENGGLDSSEWRTVVIPTSDFTTSEWPNLDQVMYLTFLKCGSTFSGYGYELKHVRMVNEAPGGGGDTATAEPTVSPSASPTLSVISTPVPSSSPSETPLLSDMNVYSSPLDGYATESSDKSCLFDYANQLVSSDGKPYINVYTNKWHSGGISFGCLEKDANGNCVHTCFDNGIRPDCSKHAALTFMAKIPNIDSLDASCRPRIRFYGSGSPAKESNTIVLEGEYVDEGNLDSEVRRKVVIPTVDLQNVSWDLASGVKSLRFLSCSQSQNPLYHVTDVRFTDSPPEVTTMAPSSAPSIRVTELPSEATHRWYNQDWFPIIDVSGSNFHSSGASEWPSDLNENDSVVIPVGSNVSVSSSASISTPIDYLVVRGTLIIATDNEDLVLQVGTIVVEEGATLIISSENQHSIQIIFDGALDPTFDPTEMMNGLVSIGGNVLIKGRPVCSKMETISYANAGENIVVVDGLNALNCWSTGDEIVLPDTQEGLNATHWGFVPHDYNPSVSQEEYLKIASLRSVGDDTEITLEANLQHSHMAGAHTAYTTRSITFRTAADSVSRAHILHTGNGAFDVYNSRVEELGRSTVDEFDSTVLEDSGVQLGEGLAKMNVVSQGTNQIARYALHAHHSLVPMEFIGNVVLNSPRFGIVAHNSRVKISENVVIATAGTGILLEDGTETGEVTNNLVFGNGGGTGKDNRFTPSNGTDVGHGGFGIWSRTIYSPIEGNTVEGVFGQAAYAFFLHINFMKDRRVPDIEGTPDALIGKTRPEVESGLDDLLVLQTFGSFAQNNALGSWRSSLDVKYAFGTSVPGGHLFSDFNVVALSSSGAGVTFSWASSATITGSFDATASGNMIRGLSCFESGLVDYDGFSLNNVSEMNEGCEALLV